MAISVPDIPDEPIPNARFQPTATVDTFGGGPGLTAANDEVQKITKQSAEIVSLEDLRANQTAVQEATAKLSAIHTGLLTDPNTGLPAYRGVNAMQGQDKVWKEYKKSTNEIYDTLHGQQQQGAFTKISLSMGDTFLQHVHAHVAQELDKHDTNTFNALVSNKATESGTIYGNDQALRLNNGLIDDATKARAQRLGLDEDESKKLMRTAKTAYHETVLSQMVNDPNFGRKAKEYFETYKSEMDSESKDRIRKLFDVVPKQREAESKRAQEEYFKANMRTAMLDMFDGKLTLSEVQRRYRENQLDRSDYNLLEGKLKSPDAGFVQTYMVSDPDTFNKIRQSQINGSASPGEIQRMIAEGSAAKEITPDDGKYLMTVNSEKPPTPRDKYIEAQANNVREFGSRYFSEKNFFGMETNKEKTNQEAESIVSDFYRSVDKSKATGEMIDEIRDRIKKSAMQKRYPGLGNLEKAPDVVIDIKGRLVRLLNPDQHSGLKPRYKITRSGPPDKEEK